MNILKYIFVVIALICNITYGQNQIVSISLYQFNENECNGINNSSASSIDSTSTCSTSNIVSYTYSELNICSIFLGYMSTFTLTSDSKINITSFNFEDCSGEPISSVIVEQNQCTMDCSNPHDLFNPYSINLIDELDIVIPENAFVTAYYSGECNGEWKGNSAIIEINVLDICSNEAQDFSVKITCNKFINEALVEKYNSNDCQGTPTNATLPVTGGCALLNGYNLQFSCTN